MTPESKVKAKCLAVVRVKCKWFFCPIKHTAMGSNGEPDLLFLFNNTLHGVEFKATEKKNPTYLQAKRLSLIEESGGISLIVDNKNTDFFIQYLNSGATEDLKLLKAHGADRWRNTSQPML